MNSCEGYGDAGILAESPSSRLLTLAQAFSLLAMMRRATLALMQIKLHARTSYCQVKLQFLC